MAPIWRGVAAEMRELGAQVEVVPVENRALGTTITVAGLLFACDVIEALRKQHGWERAYLPASMFDAELCQTLDGHTAAEVAAALGKPVCPARSAAEVLRPLPA
jgi:NifB/MoaA-like Fe-S oxidoreductase